VGFSLQVKAAEAWNSLLTSIQFRELERVRIHIHTPYKISWGGTWTQEGFTFSLCIQIWLLVNGVSYLLRQYNLNQLFSEGTWSLHFMFSTITTSLLPFSQHLWIMTDTHLSHSVTCLLYDTKLCTSIRVLLKYTDVGNAISWVSGCPVYSDWCGTRRNKIGSHPMRCLVCECVQGTCEVHAYCMLTVMRYSAGIYLVASNCMWHS
jgi:hypothetical protein